MNKPLQRLLSDWRIYGAVMVALVAVFGFRLHTYMQKVERQERTERTFLADILVHQKEAQELADQAAKRAVAPELRNLAQDIKASAESDVARYAQYQRRWHSDYLADGAEGQQGHLQHVTGAHRARMQRLNEATEEYFDTVFLAVITQHLDESVFMEGRVTATTIRHREVWERALQATAVQQRQLDLARSFIRGGFPSQDQASDQ